MGTPGHHCLGQGWVRQIAKITRLPVRVGGVGEGGGGRGLSMHGDV